MENKQLNTKDLLMNKKEEYGHRERGRYGRY